MTDPKEYIEAFIRRDDSDRCGGKRELKRSTWLCARPKGHEGPHAMVKMAVIGFTDEGKRAGGMSIETRHTKGSLYGT